MASLLELDQCLHSSGPVAPDSLDEQLEKVNKLDTQEKDYTDQQIIDLIVLGTTKIPIQHKASSSFCHFIYKQCTKQIRVSSFRASSFEKCLTYLLGGLDGDQVPGELVVDILRALSALIYENSGNTSKFYTRLTPCLLKYAERSVKPLEIRRMAINCLGNLCAGAGSKLQLYYKDIYQVLLSNLAGQTSKSMMISFTNLDLNDSAVRKVASSTLRALQFLLSQDRTLVTNPLCDIIDIIHIFLFMHVNVQSYQQLYALSSSSKESTNKTMLRTPVVNRSSRSNQLYQSPSWRSFNSKYLSNGIISSDSEMSDSDGMSFNPRRCRDDAKIRLNTLLCLLAIAKTQPKILYPHWQKFIPDTFSVFLKNHTLSTTGSTPTLYSISPILRSDHQPSSLLTLLLYDPMVTVRVAVCHTLIAMLDGSKQYLSMASKRETVSSFTSLSERLASLLHDLHLGLVYALAKETDPEVIGLIMKVMSTVMVNTSYDRLPSGYLTRFYSVIIFHWNRTDNKDNDDDKRKIQVAVLQTLAAMMTATGATLEIQELLIGNNSLDETSTLLLPLLLSLIDTLTGISLEIQVEAWRILSVCAKHHFDTVIFHAWDRIETSFDAAFSQPKLRTATLEFTEAFASSHSDSMNPEELDKCVKWWMTILEKYIQQASMDPVPDVKVLTCDCLASMAKPVFEHLSARYQRLAMALLLPLPEDEESQVRAAACRALGAFVLFPTLRQDTCFVSDMATVILDRMEDPVTLVRLRASWAQGNLCDALVIASDTPDFYLREWISISTWMKILGTSTVASLDNDKLRSNAVRAMGSLLRITSPDYFQDRHGMFLLRDAMAGLTKNIENGSLKTRWNACHAASNALKNDEFPIGFLQHQPQSAYDIDGELLTQRQEYPWTSTLFRALIQALTQCKNYKVRINAALALATPHQQTRYGHHLNTIYQTVLSVWHDCHDPNVSTEFQEYKYQEQLKHQIKNALLHLRQWLPEHDQITIDTLFITT